MANIRPLATEQGFPKPNLEQESYYVIREWEPLTAQNFEISLSEQNKIATTLDKFWQKSPLLGFGKKIAQLTKKFPDIQEKSDVSSSVYEMF